MCEQTSVNYSPGDVVWVKLGPCWWPGEVVSFDKLPSDITGSFKKPPLLVVKFFDEEKYEFIKQLANVSKYNSNKKYNYIKKGLNLHRAKHAFMDKFPGDVCTAETKTGGDPNILSDPKLGPEKKTDYSSIFGSPVPKKAKDSPGRGRGRSSLGKSPSSAKKISSFITHPRFLGNDDSEIRILVQTPNDVKVPETEYECYTCGFKTCRIDVIILHNRSHWRNLQSSSSPKKQKKTPVKRTKKRRMPKSKTLTIDEDLALLRQGLPVCSDNTSSGEDDSDEEPLVKRKPKSSTKTKSPPPVPEAKKEIDIRTDLLAEWDDDDEDEEEGMNTRISPITATETEKSKQDAEPPKVEEKDKSCFDFVEDEDDLLTTLEGRKIPRVIRSTDKRKSRQSLESVKSRSNTPKSDESKESKSAKRKETPTLDEESEIAKRRESRYQLEFEAFNNALKETVVPEINDIPPLHKYEQNFHNTKTIKFPDKSDEAESDAQKETTEPTSAESVAKEEIAEAVPEPVKEPVKEPVVRNPEVATKLTNPKKRFAKTFQDETKNSSAQKSNTSDEEPKNLLLQESKILEDDIASSAKESKVLESETKDSAVKESEPSDIKASKTLEEEDEDLTVEELKVSEDKTNKSPVKGLKMKATNENTSPKETTIDVKNDETTSEPKIKPKLLKVSKLKTELMRKLGEASSKKQNVKQVVTPRRNIPRTKKTNILSVTKIEHLDEKDNKRSMVDSLSDYGSRTNIKRKKYTSKNELVEEVASKISESSTKHKVDYEKPSVTEIHNVAVETLKSSTSSMLSELTDDEELLKTEVLSETQKLTIQDIIGVSSPILTAQTRTDTPITEHNEGKQLEEREQETPLEEKDNAIEVPLNVADKTDAFVSDDTKKEATLSDLKESKDESTIQQVSDLKVVDEEVAVASLSSEEIIENSDRVTDNQMSEVSEKLSEKVREKSTEEIETTRPSDPEEYVERIIRETKKQMHAERRKTPEPGLEQQIKQNFERQVKSKLDEIKDEKFEDKKCIEKQEEIREENVERSVKDELDKLPEKIIAEQVKESEMEVEKQAENESFTVMPEVLSTGKSCDKEFNKREKEKQNKTHEVSEKETKKKSEKPQKFEKQHKRKSEKKLGGRIGRRKKSKIERVSEEKPEEEPKITEEIPVETTQVEKIEEKFVKQIEGNRDEESVEKIEEKSVKQIEGNLDEESVEKIEEKLVKQIEGNRDEESVEKIEEKLVKQIEGNLDAESVGKIEEKFVKQIEGNCDEELVEKIEEEFVKQIEGNRDEESVEKIEEKFVKQIENRDELPQQIEESKEVDIMKDVISNSLGKSKHDLVESLFPPEEMVNIEGNLTVVSEVELADKQVEIATTSEVTKPITLASFSMDFCDDVESYVKGETILQSFSKSKSVSPITVKEKLRDNKDETVTKDPKVEKMEILQEEITGEEKKDKQDSETETVEIQSDISQTLESKSEPKEDSVKPLNEEVKQVITEESVNVESEDLQITEKLDQIKVIESDIEKNVQGDKYEEIQQDVVKEKQEIIIPPVDISVESEVAKITDSIAEQEIIIQDNHHNTTSTKLLEILTDKPKSVPSKPSPTLPATPQSEDKLISGSRQLYKSKFLSKPSIPGPSRMPKATILSEKITKPVEESKTVSVKKVTSKRSYQDVEDIDTYIIQKPVKKMNVSMESDTSPNIIKKTPPISKGKARILQQTIITPTGDILQPPVSQTPTDDNMFDINSMPIVLSDQILTPESLENMQIVLHENTTPKQQINPIKKPQATPPMKLLNKTQSPGNLAIKETMLKTPLSKSYLSPNKQKMQKVYPSSSARILKNNASVITTPGKQGKFIIVPATSATTGSKYTVGKRPTIVKKPPQKIMTPITKVPDIPMASSGNKIMIVKSQGQQQKILLTAPTKPLPQTKIKGRALGQKLIKESPQSKGANIISQTIVNSKGQVTTLANQGNRSQIIASMAQQSRNIKVDPAKVKRAQQQRLYLQNEITKPSTSGQHRTIIIKNPQGQTVKKIQGSDDLLLDQQVAEQLQAISRASATQLKDVSPRTPAKMPMKKPYMKKQEPLKQVPKPVLQTTQSPSKNVSVPPLAPISPAKKVDVQFTEPAVLPTVTEKPEEPKRPPHQLVIQDAQGNQTTITEGQILALPSEAIDGQPHSYVLVTLDETGNLTPLNSEALMSLDPNLNLTSDLGNMVLQIDQGSTSEVESPAPVRSQHVEKPTPEPAPKEIEKPPAEPVLLPETPTTEAGDQNVQAVINSGEMGQLIITGDAATAQKFLESLAEGNADLANLLANAEGNVLIQADGQQILINTDSENPMLVMNPESISNENTEGSGNPIFASQPVKNQDILAAALADTDVFQQDPSISHSPSKVAQSQLSPSSALYPMNVGNVLETNSMNSPIMTPLEVPSTNTKKIDDESEILSQVPKNVDLPITITDPNISQTVSQQQVASLMASELQANLDLPLAIQDPGMSVTTSEMSSPSFVYSLPTLDDSDINQKAFSGSISMPLLTEEPEESSLNSEGTKVENKVTKIEDGESSKTEKEDKVEIETDDKKTDFIGTEGLCAMRGGICNSLSEPPPDMFDFSVENQTYETPQNDMDIPLDSAPSSEVSNTNDQCSVSSVEERKDDPTLFNVNTTSPSTNTDDSCEIPVQPPIIAKSFEENGTGSSKGPGDEV